jgi:hypothetical protein
MRLRLISHPKRTDCFVAATFLTNAKFDVLLKNGRHHGQDE